MVEIAQMALVPTAIFPTAFLPTVTHLIKMVFLLTARTLKMVHVQILHVKIATCPPLPCGMGFDRDARGNAIIPAPLSTTDRVRVERNRSWVTVERNRSWVTVERNRSWVRIGVFLRRSILFFPLG